MPIRPEAAELFHRLHREARPLLVLPNAWDAGSARLMESLGAAAVATTSAGLAWARGYADGDRLPLALLIESVRDIARVVRVPVTVDMEGGYGADAAAVGEAVGQVVAAGAVGVNLEDGQGAPEALAAKIAAARAAAGRQGVALYINARTDVFLFGLGAPEGRLDEVRRRARLYREAGASGLFVPGLTEAAGIQALAGGTGLPLNVMARPGLPAAEELARLGARRLSAGASLSIGLWGRAALLARDFLASGRSEPLGEGGMPYPAIQALFADR